MSEFEFQRAARGSTRNTYPWGDKWDEKRCANQASGAGHPSPVGSYPGGATTQGVYDLSGNVWEWTSSPFLEYPGFKVLQIKVGPPSSQRVIDGMVAWGADRRVVVGGSFQETAGAARISTRRPTEPDQSAEGLGFRVAASAEPGIDLAQNVLEQDLAGLPRPTGIAFDSTDVALADRWTFNAGKAGTPGYALITGYDYVLFVGSTGLDFASFGQMEQASHERGPLWLGVFTTSRDVRTPALPKGTYVLTYRGASPLREHESMAPPAGGKPKDGILARSAPQQPKPSTAAGVVYPAGMKPSVANLVFFDIKGVAVAALPAGAFEYLRPDKGTVSIEPKPADAADPSAAPEVLVTMRVHCRVKVPNKGFVFTLPLVYAASDVTPDWRH
jgi:hypothetical protein